MTDAEKIAASLSDAQRRVYDLFVTDPDSCASSYLYDHYRRGRLGIKKPHRNGAAFAAWLAGAASIIQGETA